ncbi:hypothetical protein CBS101457_003075 [Exobasidium rhododendri]|nr:hypothetical protein CBS101457_003075 [Exobasidium rhododendri]
MLREVASPAFTFSLYDSPILIGAVVVAFLLLLYQLVTPPASLHGRPSSHQKVYRALPFAGLGALKFYSDRTGLLQSVLGRPEESDGDEVVHGMRLNLRSNILVASGRHCDAAVLYHDRYAGLKNAYEVLIGSTPRLPRWTTNVTKEAEETAAKEQSFGLSKVRKLTTSTHLQGLIPGIASYCMEAFNGLPCSGTIDTHDTIYRLVFRLINHAVGCAEHTKDEEKLGKISKLFWHFQERPVYISAMFPWIPTFSSMKKLFSVGRLHRELSCTIEARKTSNVKEDDFVQEMVDGGASTLAISNFILLALFAGIAQTAGDAAYLLLWIGTRPDVALRLREELFAAMQQKKGEDCAELSIEERVSRIPLDAWESKMPFLEACLAETLRHLVNIVSLRHYNPPQGAQGKASSSPVSFGGGTLQSGDFMAFWMAKVHFDASIYPDPLEWDPDRFYARKEGSEEYQFLAWGAGRSPCLGTRLAKLDIKILCACFLLSFDYSSVDSRGAAFSDRTLPRPHPNDDHAKKPVKQVRLAYVRK